jgi:hypothetical protein
MNNDIIRMQAEIDSINIRIDRAWEAIKADLARKEWLRIQIIKAGGFKI